MSNAAYSLTRLYDMLRNYSEIYKIALELERYTESRNSV